MAPVGDGIMIPGMDRLLAGAQVAPTDMPTQRLRAAIEPGKAGSIDRGGCVNLLTPARMVSKNAPGMACNSVSVEIERWEA